MMDSMSSVDLAFGTGIVAGLALSYIALASIDVSRMRMSTRRVLLSCALAFSMAVLHSSNRTLPELGAKGSLLSATRQNTPGQITTASLWNMFSDCTAMADRTLHMAMMATSVYYAVLGLWTRTGLPANINLSPCEHVNMAISVQG